MNWDPICHFSSTHPFFQEAFQGPSLAVRGLPPSPTTLQILLRQAGSLQGLHRHVYLQCQAQSLPHVHRVSERPWKGCWADGASTPVGRARLMQPHRAVISP